MRPITFHALIIFTVGVAAASPRAQAPPPTVVTTLQSAVAEALQHNPRIAAANEDVEQANIGITVARSAFDVKAGTDLSGYLGASALANQQYGVNVSRKFSTGTQVIADVASTSAQNQLGTYYSADSAIILSQPLLRGFGRAATMREVLAAESAVSSSESNKQILERQVALDVATAYYDVIRHKLQARVAAASLDRAGQLSAASAAKLEIGRVSQLDVLRADDLRAQAQAARIDADAAVEEAADRLKQLLGWPLDRSLAVTDEIVAQPPIPPAADPVAMALANRPEVRKAQNDVTAAERDIAAARDNLRPEVNLGVSLTSQGVGNTLRSSFAESSPHAALFSAVSVPFDRTRENAQLQTAVLARGRRQRDLEQVRIVIAQEVRHAIRQHARAAQNLELAEHRAALVDKEVEVARLRFDRGLSNNLDLVAAEADLLSAQERRFAALADLALARLMLRAALGMLDPRTDFR